MKYITKFTGHAAYSAAESSLVEPNVSYCVNENEVHYKPTTPSPTPTPSVIEIWADEQCTVRPFGETSVVYAQLKEPFGFGEAKTWGMDMAVRCPNSTYPDDPYGIEWDVDFIYDNGEQPLAIGVYRLVSLVAVNVEGKTYSFI